MPTRGKGSILLSGVLLGVIAAGVTGAWWRTTDGSSCEATHVGDCWTGPMAVLFLGVPVALVLAWVALRMGGALSPWLGLLVVVLSCLALPDVLGFLDLPLAAWPVIIGLVDVLYLSAERRLVSAADRS